VGYDDDRVLATEGEGMVDQFEGLLDMSENVAATKMAEPAFGYARGVQ
jgi:hypothetical protein